MLYTGVPPSPVWKETLVSTSVESTIVYASHHSNFDQEPLVCLFFNDGRRKPENRSLGTARSVSIFVPIQSYTRDAVNGQAGVLGALIKS